MTLQRCGSGDGAASSGGGRAARPPWVQPSATGTNCSPSQGCTNHPKTRRWLLDRSLLPTVRFAP
eukprot:6180717-Pleurochrysis_carterae.AAC.1